MVRRGLDAVDLQGLGDFFDFLSAQAVNNAAAALVLLGVLDHLPESHFPLGRTS